MSQSLSDDMMEGAAEIGAFLDKTPRQTFYLLESGQIDGAFKLGNVWHGRKSIIREGIERREQEAMRQAAAKRAAKVAERAVKRSAR
jgi:hypothetical protein